MVPGLSKYDIWVVLILMTDNEKRARRSVVIGGVSIHILAGWVRVAFIATYQKLHLVGVSRWMGWAGVSQMLGVKTASNIREIRLYRRWEGWAFRKMSSCCEGKRLRV